jgi:type III pantothenate kinase
MLLTIDIGNTNLTLGLFTQEEMSHHWRLATDHKRMPDEYGLQILGVLHHAEVPVEEIEGICISSVVPDVGARVVRACQTYLEIDPLEVSYDKKTGISILYEEPKAVGADRIVDAIAVSTLYDLPACFVDFGTATTFNAIDKDKNYLGGAICPGIGISSDALFERTAKLPRVNIQAPDSVIGTNTTHAIQSGLMFGYVSLFEGMVSRFRDILGENMTVITTGGFSELIAKQTEIIDVVDPWLTLNGLRLFWEMNK